MKKTIRAVFFDVDGTLISYQTHRMPQSTLRALESLRSNGIKTVISTGRPPAAIGFLDEFFHFDAYITTNGQYCYCDDHVIHQKAFRKSEMEQLVCFLQKTPFPCLFIEKDELYINFVNDTVRAHCTLTDQPVPKLCGLERALEHDIFQFVAFVDPVMEKKMTDHLPFVKPVRAVPMCIDVMPSGGGKAVGLDAVAKYFQIGPDETMAFGDGSNDLDMIQYAGIGIAMGNANQTLKQCADYVTDTVENDGILNAALAFGLIHSL